MAETKMRQPAHLVVLSIAIICTCACTKRNAAGQPFPNPVMLGSRDGKLRVDLVAAPATYAIGGHQFQGMLYNAQYMPPLWRLRAGDILTVMLHNQLSEETNLHFHGLNVSPLNNGDNVFLHIAPRQTFTYQIKIPERHIGLFWYHPHAHGDVDRQIIGGMSGGILVEGSDRLYPFLKGLTERVLLLKHHPIGRADYEELVTVNGIITPTISIRPGEAQFWQIGNIGADRFLRLKIDGMPFYLIGRDGYFVPRPIRMEEVILGPGQRFSAIVVGGQTGRYQFKSVAFKFDERQPPLPEVSLGNVVSAGPASDVTAAEAKVSAQHVNGPLYVDMVRSSPMAQKRTFAFSVNPQKTSFFINDQVFDENRTDVTVKLGDTEEWTILNKDSQYHDFHIHQTGFLVTEVNGAPADFDGLRDTFSVPPARNGKPGEAKLIIPFTNPEIVGRFVFHCHVVKHEDKGMMMTVEVVR
ncbi:MAG TPA: multicopper oxidase family protein [Chthoniobacterales bacterium]|nr:multicopper oxidase family protein [Chthoniobacterales bacterium]